MPEELTSAQRLENIQKRALEILENQINESNNNYGSVREIGNALKALAEGIECYKKATKKIKMS